MKLLNKYNQPHVETTIVSYASESSNDNCFVVLVSKNFDKSKAVNTKTKQSKTMKYLSSSGH